MRLRRRLEPGLRLRMKSEARRIADQHRRLEGLKDQVASEMSGASLKDARASFELYAEALEAHFAVEERFYFPAIHGLDAELAKAVEALLVEHERFRSQVSDLLGYFVSGDGAACAALLETLVNELAAHERAEERAMRRAGEPG